MAYFFLGIILIFAVAATCYLWANDFSRETLDVIYPAIGAILLSVYLGIKIGYLDAPAPKKFGATVAVLHDQNNGLVTGMTPKRFERSSFEFRGAELLDTLQHYNDLKEVKIPEILKQAPPPNTPIGPADRLIEDYVEYAILKWLSCYSDMEIGFKASREIKLIGGAGGWGGALDDKGLVPIQAGLGSDEPNLLLRAKDITLKLPKGSKIIRPLKSDNYVDILIKTPHSDIKILSNNILGTLLGSPVGESSGRIYDGIGLSHGLNGVRMLGFNVEFEASQKPLTRFSKQAKTEAKWIDRIQEQFEKDFSWPRLENLYLNRKPDF